MVEIEILYEDGDVCVINKPSGAVVNDSNSTDGNTIQKWFTNKYPISNVQFSIDSEFKKKGGVVHRLDKDASGVLILAKNELSYEYLKEQFVNREVGKTYLTLVHGRMKDGEGVISTPIERNPNKKMRFFVGKDLARTGVTAWRVIKDNEKYSFLEVTILTGRTHQIRVHMKYLGHPILSDPLYGNRKTWELDLQICPRLFLHASKLEIRLPDGEKKMFVATLPKSLKSAYEKIFV